MKTNVSLLGDFPLLRRWSLLILGMIVFCLGVYLRVADLGRFGFWWDELYHVLAAKSLIHDGSTFIAPIGNYNRALPFTLLVEGSFRLFGISEWAARLPTVFFNLLFIVSSFFLVARFFDQKTAFLFAFIMLFSPFEIVMSRECRMYTGFQFFYFFMTLAFYWGFEQTPNSAATGILAWFSKKGMSLPWLLAAAMLGVCSLAFHALTLFFIIPLETYLLAMIFVVWRTRGLRRMIASKYFILFTVSMLLLVTGNFLLHGKPLARFLGGVNPPVWWSSAEPSGASYLRRFLSDNYPAIFFAYPLSIFFMLREHGRKALYLVCLFVPLFFLHNFVFGRKLDRYIFYIYPFLVLGSAYGWAKLFALIGNQAMEATRQLGKWSIPVALIGLLVGVNVLGFPWLLNSKNVHKHGKFENWKVFPPELREQIRQSTVITTRNMAFEYYFGRKCDYYLRAIQSEYKYIFNEKHAIKIIDNLPALEAAMASSENVYLVMDRWTFKNDSIVPEPMRQWILDHCDEVKLNVSKEIYILKKKVSP